ncbi:MAG: response regulator [Dissulfurispiraceae bacterium]
MSKRKIFLVDDDELIVSTLSRALKNEGYEVYAETNTRDIIDKIKYRSPDLVLLDVNLPDRSGIDILRELKIRVDTRVVMLTADDTAETAMKAMKLGAADYLTKPFNLVELKLTLRSIMDNVKLKQELA